MWRMCDESQWCRPTSFDERQDGERTQEWHLECIAKRRQHAEDTTHGKDCAVDGITNCDRRHAFMAWGCLWKMRGATRHSLWPSTSVVLLNVCKFERSNTSFHGLRPWGGWHVAQATRWSPCRPFEFQSERAIGESLRVRHVLLHRHSTSLVCFAPYRWRASMCLVGCFHSKTRRALCVRIRWGATKDPLNRHLSFSSDPASSTHVPSSLPPYTSPLPQRYRYPFFAPPL